MKDQGERVVIGPRDAIAAEGLAVAGTRRLLTPLRVALLIVGAVVGGVALSLLLGTAPAHASDGDGVPTPDGGLLGGTTSLVANVAATTTTTTTTATTTTVGALDSTLTTSVSTAVPPVRTLVQATGDTVSAVAPIAAPIVKPVVAAVNGTLTAAVQLIAPIHEVLWGVAAAGAPNALVAPSTQAFAVVAGAASGTVSSLLNPAPSGSTDGALPSPLLASSAGGPAAAALGALFLVLALALLAGRRRLHDDALPPFPVFETDTSPA